MIFDRENSSEELKVCALRADIVFHFAGVNRPRDPLEFARVNTGLTEHLCQLLREGRHSPKIVFSSSVQAAGDNLYGSSKAKAEASLRQFSSETGACVRIYRLKNLFGKWCKPNYNSVTATFCHNIANDLPVTVSDPDHELDLSYIDDVMAAFLAEIDGQDSAIEAGADIPGYRITLGDLAGRIKAFRAMRNTLTLPDFGSGSTGRSMLHIFRMFHSRRSVRACRFIQTRAAAWLNSSSKRALDRYLYREPSPA